MLQLKISLNSFFGWCCNSKSVWILFWAVLQLKTSLNSFLSCVATQNQLEFFPELVATQKIFFELCCNYKFDFFEWCCNSKSVWILFWVVLQLKTSLNSFLRCVATQNQLISLFFCSSCVAAQNTFEFYFELCCKSRSVWILFWVLLQLKTSLNSFVSCVATKNQFNFFFQLCCNLKSAWILFWCVLQLKISLNSFLTCVATQKQLIRHLFWVLLQLKISYSRFFFGKRRVGAPRQQGRHFTHKHIWNKLTNGWTDYLNTDEQNRRIHQMALARQF